MPLDWGEFLSYFCYQQDQSPFASLFYDRLWEVYVDLFADVPSTSLNERPSAKGLTTALNINRSSPFYFGSHHFRRPLAFTAAPMYRKRFGIEPPKWAAEERAKSLFVLENVETLVRQAEQQGGTIPPMDTTYPPTFEHALAGAYAPHRRLAEWAGLDLQGLGYPVGD
jgi:hypothetical protein